MSAYGDADHFQYALIHAQLGMIEDSVKELELAWTARNSDLASMRVDPFLDPLRSDRRFALIERRLGFP
ncbi:MAG TPA: hypothetical protein VHS33_10805 [Sphingomicrobium sp.]|jgi:hypothetical protein|nr:hypothetical protein [Sphingomicrobium sp.]